MTQKNEIKGTQCGFCKNIIFIHNESGGMLHVKSGVPICARCRILKRSPLAKEIKRDKKKLKQDIIERDRLREENETKRIEEVALASQLNAKDSDSEKKRTMRKKGF